MEDDILLPRQVIDRLEHRWASRLQQDLKMWSDRSRPAPVHHVLTDGARVRSSSNARGGKRLLDRLQIVIDA